MLIVQIYIEFYKLPKNIIIKNIKKLLVRLYKCTYPNKVAKTTIEVNYEDLYLFVLLWKVNSISKTHL